MRSTSRLLLAGVSFVALVTCREPFGALDNPADTRSETYQGFQTVSSIAAVVQESPAEGATVGWLAFVLSACPAAEVYALRIGDGAGTTVYERSDFTTNLLRLTDASLVAGGYTWLVRARGAGGDWPAWSVARGFTLAGTELGAVYRPTAAVRQTRHRFWTGETWRERRATTSRW